MEASELACQPKDNTGKLLLTHASHKFKCVDAIEVV